MDLNEYQKQALETAIFPKEIALEYNAIALTGEWGELCNKLKKVLRGDKKLEDISEDLAFELGDCLWYMASFANELGYDLETIAQLNLLKLRDRRTNGTIKGDGDHR